MKAFFALLCLFTAISAFQLTGRTLSVLGKLEAKSRNASDNKKVFTIRTDADGNMSSEGLLSKRKELQTQQRKERNAVRSNLGVQIKTNSKNNTNQRPSKNAEKITRQRQGTVDSTSETTTPPGDQRIQIQAMKRGNKTVTIVRGLTCPMDERRSMLKELKAAVGGGGSLVSGVMELQGSHGPKILEFLHKRGFGQTKLLK